MTKEILMPSTLNARNSFDFCNFLDSLELTDKLIFDHKYLGSVEPFGMLLIASKIRKLVKDNPNVNFCDANYASKSYAAHMGFFQSVYLNYGNKPGEAKGSNNYIPITKVNVKDLKIKSYEKNEPVQATIEKESRKLARVLSHNNEELEEYLTYSTRELMRNIVEHSTSETIWFAAQYWSTKDLVEIALLDEGVGIRQAISVNPHLKISNDEDALLLAIEPGISGVAFKGRKPKKEDDGWINSGYGLYLTSSLCQKGGSFLLCSGSKALTLVSKRYRFDEINFNGTAIRMRLKVSKINNLKDTLKELVTEGEQRAKKISSAAVLSASKVSRMITTI